MPRLPRPTTPTRGLLARWRAVRRQQRRPATPPHSRDEWGMESALPWLQADSRA